MSQYGLALACGVRQTTIGRIETGKVKSPRTALVAKIAAALGTNIESLIGDVETVPSRPRLVARTDDATERILEALATISADIVTMKADISDTKARLDAIETRGSPPAKGHGNGSKRGSRQ